MGGASWYNAEPLRLAFVDELGSKEGNEQFKRYMSIVERPAPEVTSGRTSAPRPTTSTRNAWESRCGAATT